MVREWRAALLRGEVIHPFSDYPLAPLSLPFVVEALLRIGTERRAGVWQLSGPADVSWADMARYLAGRLEVDPDLVQPRRHVLGRATPRFTSMDTQRVRDELGLTPPDPWQCVDALLKTWDQEV